MNTLQTLRSSSYGYNPDPEELSHIFQSLSRSQEDLQSLEMQILHLQSQREQLQTRVHHLNSLLAPIRRLPPELLLKIFRICCPASIISIDCVDSPVLVISQVCTGWRDLVHNTPILW
ncbi:hypothetical protein K435DRAFT_663014, partial [Dendrothele bispora CBS 962.96]